MAGALFQKAPAAFEPVEPTCECCRPWLPARRSKLLGRSGMLYLLDLSKSRMAYPCLAAFSQDGTYSCNLHRPRVLIRSMFTVARRQLVRDDAAECGPAEAACELDCAVLAGNVVSKRKVRPASAWTGMPGTTIGFSFIFTISA